MVRADPTRERRRERPRLARQLARARRGDRSFPTTGPRTQLPRSIGCPAGSERRNDDTEKQGTLVFFWWPVSSWKASRSLGGKNYFGPTASDATARPSA